MLRYGLSRRDQNTWRNGPKLSGKVCVFSTWIPAVCVPLNGVGPVLGQRFFTASAGVSNQMPRWKVWIGLNAGLVPASRLPCGFGAGAHREPLRRSPRWRA